MGVFDPSGRPRISHPNSVWMGFLDRGSVTSHYLTVPHVRFVFASRGTAEVARVLIGPALSTRLGSGCGPFSWPRLTADFVTVTAPLLSPSPSVVLNTDRVTPSPRSARVWGSSRLRDGRERRGSPRCLNNGPRSAGTHEGSLPANDERGADDCEDHWGGKDGRTGHGICGGHGGECRQCKQHVGWVAGH